MSRSVICSTNSARKLSSRCKGMGGFVVEGRRAQLNNKI